MSAIIVGPYRYRLDRVASWPHRHVACVLGVNPSIAGAELNDHTVRKVLGFAAVNCWSHIILGNKFAFRATNVNALKTAADPVGPLNDTFLMDMLTEADTVVAAWGSLNKLPPALRGRWKEVYWMAHRLGKTVKCFGVAKDGQPLHPLTLSYQRPVVPWTPPRLLTEPSLSLG